MGPYYYQVFNILGNVLLAVWHIQKEQNGLLGVCNISVGPWLQYYIPGRDICRRDIRERQIV